MKIVKWSIIAVISGILVVFALANREQMTLTLFPLPFEVDIPVFLLIFMAVMIGLLLGGMACLSYALSCLNKARVQTARVAALEQEVAALKAVPHIVNTHDITS